MGEILSFGGDPHRAMEMLLPWYATGNLDAEDVAGLQAHLDGCAQCRASLEREEGLKARVRQLPLQADLGWAKLRHRLVSDRCMEQSQPIDGRRNWWAMVRPVVAPFAVGQAMFLVIAILLFRAGAPHADYRAPGVQPASTGGNLIVMFRSGATDQELRFAIDRAGARLVEGPISAGSYLLDVPVAQRDAALRDLRTRRSILFAQPVDPGGP